MSDAIGAMNKRIEIQAKTSVRDTMGSFTDTWATLYTRYAAIWPTQAKEVIQSNSLTMIATHRIRIRYKAGIDASYRIKYGTRYFSIVGIINPQEDNRWLDLICKEAS